LQVSLVAKDAREELEQTRDGRFERAEPLRGCRLGLFRRAGWRAGAELYGFVEAQDEVDVVGKELFLSAIVPGLRDIDVPDHHTPSLVHETPRRRTTARRAANPHAG
jgi:hypothetical protein